jgi:hypothetical protein
MVAYERVNLCLGLLTPSDAETCRIYQICLLDGLIVKPCLSK